MHTLPTPMQIRQRMLQCFAQGLLIGLFTGIAFGVAALMYSGGWF
jgi:hypothetical protein